ncbi:recombinase family protein [Streptomyces sp. NPDC001661]
MGYARVSTKGQLLDRQIHALTDAGCSRVFSTNTAELPRPAMPKD